MLSEFAKTAVPSSNRNNIGNFQCPSITDNVVCTPHPNAARFLARVDSSALYWAMAFSPLVPDLILWHIPVRSFNHRMWGDMAPPSLKDEGQDVDHMRDQAIAGGTFGRF
jgi:hypothetical protein